MPSLLLSDRADRVLAGVRLWQRDRASEIESPATRATRSLLCESQVSRISPSKIKWERKKDGAHQHF